MITPLELIYGTPTGVRIVSVDGIRADLLFFPGVELMMDVEALCVVEVIHPVVHQRVFFPFLGLNLSSMRHPTNGPAGIS